MRLRTTLIALLLLVLCGVFVYVFEVRWPEEKKRREDETAKIFSPEWNEVTGLRITGSGGTLLLERKQKEAKETKDTETEGSGGAEPAWRIVEPVQTDADDASIVTIMRDIRDLRQEQVVAENPEDLAPFGLQERPLRVELITREGVPAPGPLLVGDKSPVGENSYARREGRPEVILLNVNAASRLDKSLYDMRAKKVFGVDRQDVEKVEILRNGQPALEMTRVEDGWEMIRPVRAPVKREEADKILNRVEGLTARSFDAEAAEDLAPFGLDAPPREVRVTLAPDQAQASLKLGATHSDGGQERVYAKRGEKPQVVSLDADFLEIVDVAPDTLRERRVFPFSSWKVDKVELAWDGQDAALEKRGTGKWWITRPEEARAASSAVTPILSGLSAMEGTAFFDRPTTPEGMKRFGLAPPLAKVTVYEEKIDMDPSAGAGEGQEDSEAVGTLLLGKVEEGASGARYYAYREGEPTVAEVGEQFFVRDLPKDLESLREKRVLDFYRYQVASVTIQGPGTELLLEKEGNDWGMKKPAKRSVDAAAVDDLLGFLSGLKVDRFATAAGSGAGQPGQDLFGPAALAARVTLNDEQGEEIATASFSTQGPADATDARYVRMHGAPKPGLIGKEHVEQLFEKIEKIDGKS